MIRRHVRRGLTLLEVILALTILGISLATVGTLVSLGTRSAVASRDVTEAQLICQTVMAEIAAGIMPPQVIPPTPYAMNPLWQVDVLVVPSDLESLLVVQVGAQRADDMLGRSRFQLVRFIADPAVTAQVDADAEAAEADAAAAAAADAAYAEAASSTASPFGASTSFGPGGTGGNTDSGANGASGVGGNTGGAAGSGSNSGGGQAGGGR